MRANTIFATSRAGLCGEAVFHICDGELAVAIEQFVVQRSY
ncbi:hypothetical protein SFMTTN_0053 [Sulfuriferula multivorans]|uniref:Uncharacterized protein n=1 Tax=Sulfuriferula multivorans TaxID=1559896 RepID=A0A401J9B0_9PROT|nr:hypothetical protein SFMTTN_0053 [Sulfuriferula multivorans]